MSRFLFATMPVPGHVAPITPVARTLVERGHDIVWYGSKYHADSIVRSGASFRPIRSTVDYGDGRYDEHFPGRDRFHGLRKVVFDFEHAFVNATAGYLTDLREICHEFHPDAMVHDPAVIAGAIMGISDGLPAATINISVLSIEGRNVGPFGLGLLPADGPLGRLRNRAMFGLVDHVIFGRVNRAYRRLAAQHDWPVLPVRPRAGDWLFLQPSVEAFEYPRPDLPQLVHFIGPLLPAVPEDFIPPAWWANVENARSEGTPVVLVTQGTVATDASELIEPTLQALESEDLFVVAAGADASDLEHIPTNAQVERFVSFTALMPLVDGYVTNGGYGGVTIALANGVPVVSGGTTEDKAEVGQRVAYSGVGINLKTNRPSERKLRDAIKTILGEPGFRTRAAVIQTDFARHDAPAEAADLLERLADAQQPVLRA
ncbi:MAG TPA: nucleotide disphospho-sugar-binding domain-containing protein [Gemmatimonadales bacterium]|nr:nucleotide disphospho-sugar-binding domain-containing protein [Gemmatimonadales bacterium]